MKPIPFIIYSFITGVCLVATLLMVDNQIKDPDVLTYIATLLCAMAFISWLVVFINKATK